MKKNKKLSYIIIGIFTLALSIIGATFSYFMATASNAHTIAVNMATVHLDLNITKKTNVDEVKGGLIPMTNAMVQKAVTNASTHGICVDNNNNAVCQIYKITVNNTGTAHMFVDGYVTLTGGSGTPTDYPSSPTTMRWAQIFCTENNNNLSSCTTAGSPTVRQTNNISWSALGNGTGHDTGEIKDNFNNITTTGTISGNSYNIINTNYIRVSNHTGNTYSQTNDVTSALVFNQLLTQNDNNASNNTGDSSATYTDSQSYYIVVWLSENGLDQTAGSGGTNVPNSRNNFFDGTVTFTSSEGSQVTGKFSGYTRVGNESQATPTKFTGTIYRSSTERITIGEAITTITSYQTTPINQTFYLKHTVVNDIVTESYVIFVVTPGMASTNAKMRSGTYTLRGAGATPTGSGGYNDDSPYYTSNVNTLKQAFGENNSNCSDFSYSSGVACEVPGLGPSTYSDGRIDVNDGIAAGCYVDSNGSSTCYV